MIDLIVLSTWNLLAFQIVCPKPLDVGSANDVRTHDLIGISSLLAIVPNISRELPVVSDLFPDHNIFPGHFLRCRALGLQAEGPDLARRGGSERLDVEGYEFRIANLFRHAFPHRPNGGVAMHHRRTGWECDGISGVERCDASEIALVEELGPFRVDRLNIGLLGRRRCD